MLDRVDPDAAAILRDSSGFWKLSTPGRERVQRGFDAVDAQYREQIAGVFGERIKRGTDGYTEFALRPAYEYEALVPVVEGLYEEDILRRGEAYPLHVTLGSLPCDSRVGLLLMAVELAGGTTPDRIVQKGTWEQKGIAGVLGRKAHELAFDMTTGVELRSLAATSPEAVARAMRMAQYGGAILLGRLAAEARAGETWRELYHLLTYSAQERGLDANRKWQNPSREETVWIQFGILLADSDWREQTARQAEEIVAA